MLPIEVTIVLGLLISILPAGLIFHWIRTKYWQRTKRAMERKGPDRLVWDDEVDSKPKEPSPSKLKILIPIVSVLIAIGLGAFFMFSSSWTGAGSWTGVSADGSLWWVAVLALPIAVTIVGFGYMYRDLSKDAPLVPGAPPIPRVVVRAGHAGLKVFIVVSTVFLIAYAINQISAEYPLVGRVLNESGIRHLATSAIETWSVNILVLLVIFAFFFSRTTDIRLPRYVSGDTPAGYIPPIPRPRRTFLGGTLTDWRERLWNLLIIGLIIGLPWWFFWKVGLVSSPRELLQGRPIFQHASTTTTTTSPVAVRIEAFQTTPSDVQRVRDANLRLRAFIDNHRFMISNIGYRLPTPGWAVVPWPRDINGARKRFLVALRGEAWIGPCPKDESTYIAASQDPETLTNLRFERCDQISIHSDGNAVVYIFFTFEPM